MILPSVCLIYTTLPSLQTAKEMAEILLNEKLIACANIFPRTISIYRWQSEIVENEEVVCIFKTTIELQEVCQKAIIAHHPYETPCVLFLSVPQGEKNFIKWIETSVKPARTIAEDH